MWYLVFMREPVVQGTSFGRYEIVDELAAGGMGTVYLGRMRAARGVSLNVAIKRINRALAGDPHVLGMFVDEARITSLIRHPNVVQTLDVVEEGGELLLVMEYVHGVSLARLLAAAREHGERLPLAVASRIASDVLNGLHAAHETTNEVGRSLEIVHRDVSPQNIIVGVDGIARVADFGIARAANRVETTKLGEIKGKLRYIAPEQFGRESVDRRADIYGVGLLLWEMITGAALRQASSPGGLTHAILTPRVDPPSSVVAEVPPALDDLVLRSLANDPRERFPFAAQMAVALEEVMAPAPYAKVAEVVRELAQDELTGRRAMLDRAAAMPSLPALAATPSSPPLPRESASPAPVVDDGTVVDPPGSGGRRRALALGAGGLVIVAALAVTLRRSAPPKAAEITPAETQAPSAEPPAPAELPVASVAPAAPEILAPPARAAHSRKAPRTPPPRPKPDCTIPYVVDRNGIRVPRHECM